MNHGSSLPSKPRGEEPGRMTEAKQLGSFALALLSITPKVYQGSQEYSLRSVAGPLTAIPTKIAQFGKSPARNRHHRRHLGGRFRYGRHCKVSSSPQNP